MTAEETQSSPAAAAAGPLAGLRVVELGDGTAGPYAAKLLGDFGAEVVKIESPRGDSARQRGPFADDRPDPEASGLFEYLNTNKYGIVLDLELKTRQGARRWTACSPARTSSSPTCRRSGYWRRARHRQRCAHAIRHSSLPASLRSAATALGPNGAATNW